MLRIKSLTERIFLVSATVMSILIAMVFLLPSDSCFAQGFAQRSYYVAEAESSRFPRIPAEYEQQRALLLSISDWQPHHSPIFTQIVKKTHGHVDLLVLYNDRKQLELAVDWLVEANLETDHVHFCNIPLDTVWVRDFAPVFSETKAGDLRALDFYYVGGQRPKDEVLPKQWTQTTEARYVEAPWTLQGGNLLVNGKSLGVTTSRIFKDNYITFQSGYSAVQAEYERRKIVAQALLKVCNLKLLVVLEPLQYEATKHCDMFATFIADDQVVMAEVDPRSDPQNAAILDRNAAKMSKIKIGDRDLQVHRIRIPTREGTSWSAYTNCIIANDLILMPVFSSDPPELVRQAVQTYERLMPSCEVKTVDMTSMKKLQGELHCLSAHIPQNSQLPRGSQSLAEVRKILGK